MPVPRLRMRPWLEKQIESKAILGLSWINKEEGIFQIPWKHAARHGWDMDKDASLFRSWAIHTGRYKQGEKEPDPKTWKANFRCAMNSLPDIKEVKDKSIYKGSSAVRVYKMLPAPVKTEKKERKSKSLKDSKSKPRKKVDSLSADELEEAVKHCQLPEDHSGYTAPDFSIQEATGSSDIGLSQNEISIDVPPWNDDMEMILPDSTNDHYHFQVSPMPSSSEGDDGDILSEEEFLAILDTNTDWQPTHVGGRGYLTNEPGTASSYLNNPSSLLDELNMLGEIQVRVTTDMKPTEFTWQELTAITCL
ncbi:PREDICTED: interferon regulatory factor 1 [Nanorana parkeri]|uniref:Interferon regulatory factor n=1 Tax=Nanorana parkeri TaxID=125878 RepID=A0AA49K9N9_9NEOB|nr:PREDICTED: interferon regulatory factor 1 [Nanorana parkeri]WLF82010.1 interferon regulatory factor 1 [Nanorana parkeri]